MSWFRTDDRITSHPKWVAVKRAAFDRCPRSPRDARALAQRAALSWFAMGVWGSGNNCDGIFPVHAADQIAAGMFLTEEEFIEGVELLAAGGMCQRLPKSKGGPGWQIPNWLKYQPSREQVTRTKDKEQRRKELYNTVEGRQILAAVKRRDGDYCRFCWTRVDWNDRRSAHRGTVDHLDPDGDNSVENCVVACGHCNRRKAERTLLAAEMELKPPYMPAPRDETVSSRELFANSLQTSRELSSRGGRDGIDPEQIGSDLAGSERFRSGRKAQPGPSSDSSSYDGVPVREGVDPAGDVGGHAG